MRWLTRLRYGGISELEAELFANRSEPSKELTTEIVALVRPRQVARPSRLRLAPAAALTAALVGALGATGGFAYAAQTAFTHKSGPRAGVSTACSQYATPPKVHGRPSPRSGRVGTKVTIGGDRFSGINRITRVTFAGGEKARFRVLSASKLVAKVPRGAKTGGITVFNCAGHATTPKFTVK